jgi:hypothetical protein
MSGCSRFAETRCDGKSLLLPAEMQQALAQHLAQVALNRYPVPSYSA